MNPSQITGKPPKLFFYLTIIKMIIRYYLLMQNNNLDLAAKANKMKHNSMFLPKGAANKAEKLRTHEQGTAGPKRSQSHPKECRAICLLMKRGAGIRP